VIDAGWATNSSVFPIVPSQIGSEPIGDAAPATLDTASSDTDGR
jgi:hypothetical protein